MATDAPAAPVKAAPKNPATPVNWDDHQADLERRREERKRNEKTHRACLKAETAAQLEAAKPLYDFEVAASFDIQGEKGLEPFSKKLKLRAQNEADAWAMYCDKVGHWPSRAACEELKIKQLSKAN